MKASFFSVFALGSLFLGAFAAPAPAVEVAQVEKRQADLGQVFQIVDGLYTNIQTYTGTINETTSGLGSDASAQNNPDAVATLKKAIQGITQEIKAATRKVTQLPSAAGGGGLLGVLKREDAGALAGLVSNLLLELSGALEGVVSTLGLDSLLGLLNPLTTALSGLLLGLDKVVDQVLNLVKGLLDGLLGGAGNGLAGGLTGGLSSALSGGLPGVLSGLAL
ncbi:uncharacterized protein K452DRAFT_320126 [Aplosporella prunicola CBS 121167]|uniref:Cell wall protein n=1 Tax=Aplosporella prunicola CBS 121167 TaxID=1176127 RepID=A0A6A6B7M3_9PEZI|nr:uncharacterized protein K452DRAFT_320126 [Aplosporella prunicola CBS 121167]KAF2140060.1 hypothetical protein K452DRAFT_320126 [Aplosporella prunicola CBS 121167]